MIVAWTKAQGVGVMRALGWLISGVLSGAGLVHCGGSTVGGGDEEVVLPPAPGEVPGGSAVEGSEGGDAESLDDASRGAENSMLEDPVTSLGAAGAGAVNDSGIGSSGGNPAGTTCAAEPGPGAIRLVPDDYPSIQQAIDASDFGDTVKVAAGVFEENLTLKSGVILSGAGAGDSILDGGGRGESLIDATATEGAVVRGFTLRNVGQAEGCANPTDPLLCAGSWYAAAIYIDGHLFGDDCPTSLEIAENSIENCDIGVMLSYQPYGAAFVHDNRFLDNRVALVANHHGSGSGEITHNLFLNSDDALVLDATYLDVTHNLIVESTTVLMQDHIQAGELSCNLLYGYGSLGNRIIVGEDNNVESDVYPVFEERQISADAPATGCVSDSGESIAPGPRSDVEFDP